jgi:hypothetical protein
MTSPNLLLEPRNMCNRMTTCIVHLLLGETTKPKFGTLPFLHLIWNARRTNPTFWSPNPREVRQERESVGVCRANISAVGFRPSNGHSCFVVFTYCINSASIESPVLPPSSLLLPPSSSSSQPALPPGNRQQRTHSVHRPRGKNNSENI